MKEKGGAVTDVSPDPLNVDTRVCLSMLSAKPPDSLDMHTRACLAMLYAKGLKGCQIVLVQDLNRI